jgi:hypothetical protein
MASDSSPVMTEAKAKIIWGESPASVRDFLISKGISGSDADAKIQEFYLERNAEVRRSAVKSIIVGTVLVIAACILYYVTIRGYGYYGDYRGAGSAIGAAIFAGIYGFWRLMNGIFDLFRPQSEKGLMSVLDADE